MADILLYMQEALDLDILTGSVKTIVFRGKEYKCYQPTVRQLIEIAKADEEIRKINDPKKMLDMLMGVLRPIIPELIDEKDFDPTMDQISLLIAYAQNQYVPDQAREVAEEYSASDPKKK